MSPTVPSQLPYFLSPLEWCHRPAGDVTSTPPPHPLHLSPLSTRLQSLASHCGLGQSTEHVPNTDRNATMRVCWALNINHLNYAIKAKQLNANKYNNITKCVIPWRLVIGLLFYGTRSFPLGLYERKKGNNLRRAASKHCNTTRCIAPDPVTSPTFALKTSQSEHMSSTQTFWLDYDRSQ